MKKKINMYYISQILLFLASSMFNPVSYLFYLDNGINAAFIGINISMLWITSSVFEVPFGIFTDRYGTRLTMILSNLLSLTGLSILIFKTNNFTLLISAGIFGISGAANSGCLSSWIVNVYKKENESSFKQEILQKIFSKSNIMCSLVSMVFSFLMLQIVYKIDKMYPIYLSFIAYFVCMLFFILVFSDYSKTKTVNNTVYFEFRNYFKQIDFNFFKISFFFTIPYIMDIGPVNQWTIVFKKTDLLGYINVLIVLSVIFANFIISKLKISQKNLKKFIFSDLIIIIFLGVIFNYNSYISILFFLIHVIINTIILGINNSYFHTHVIKDDDKRNTLISTFNFFNSIIVGILLQVEGLFSHFFGYINSWYIFSIFGFIVYYILFKYIKFEKQN